MDGGDLILEVGVADDDPRRSRTSPRRSSFDPEDEATLSSSCCEVGLRPDELCGGQGLEDDRRGAGGCSPNSVVERDRGGRQREEPLARRPRELLLAEENVTQPHYGV